VVSDRAGRCTGSTRVPGSRTFDTRATECVSSVRYVAARWIRVSVRNEVSTSAVPVHSSPPLLSEPLVFMYPGALHASAKNRRTPYLWACLVNHTCAPSSPSQTYCGGASGPPGSVGWIAFMWS
jgi:hypothetical protein